MCEEGDRWTAIELVLQAERLVPEGTAAREAIDRALQVLYDFDDHADAGR